MCLQIPGARICFLELPAEYAQFLFLFPVNARRPLDLTNDPPPDGWEVAIPWEYRGSLSYTSVLVRRCRDWEKREMRRHKKMGYKQNRKYWRGKRLPVIVW